MSRQLIPLALSCITVYTMWQAGKDRKSVV